ncbi:pimeloyl-ACP methyl ester esterase BioH [Colwellia asteriadis]|uniref:Pimeloyl-[acyl-carrier protein] methyl ester esterase n=1 Tax=Colwellia asteriadis TaxID=517723 RepID=A0ABN1L815_9GAMM
MAKNLAFTTTPSHTLRKDKGEHKIPVVLIHGWGLNSGVWQPLLELLSAQDDTPFEYITVDLPGFGQNSELTLTPYSLDNICETLNKTLTKPAIYLGWSLGGLVATHMALHHPNKVLGLITVASSPYFVEEEYQQNNTIWPGIKSHVLTSFHQQLAQDTAKTITGFLKIQAMGSPHIRQDLKLITQLVMAHTLPNKKTLDESLNLLSDSDLRIQLKAIEQPFLRLYGNNDSLVPKKVINLINDLAPKSEQHTFMQASHAPFISHLDDFHQVLKTWLGAHFLNSTS